SISQRLLTLSSVRIRSRIYTDLRLPNPSSNCNSFGFHGGSVEGGNALLAPITSEDGEKVRRLQHQGVREEEGGRRVPREHEALRPVRDRHGFRRGDVSARGREAAGVCVHLVRSQCQERHGGEELMTPPIQRY
ncbi:hypothetical protein B296_00022085, partial [Ensete ventricosum]